MPLSEEQSDLESSLGIHSEKFIDNSTDPSVKSNISEQPKRIVENVLKKQHKVAFKIKRKQSPS